MIIALTVVSASVTLVIDSLLPLHFPNKVFSLYVAC